MTGFDVFLSVVLLSCVAAVIHPFVIYPAILKLLPGKAVRRDDRHRPSASLLFCAYNEREALPFKLDNLEVLKGAHPSLEILAFDDGSADGSAALLDARSDLLTLVAGTGRSGKAHGMKRLAALAGGDVLIFTDANVTLAPEAVANLLSYYADPDVGGVLGSLHYLGGKDSATASVGSLYWRIEENLKDLESRSGNVMGADGSIFSVRRSLYPDFPDSVLDDLTVSMAVVFAGKRLIKARDVIAYERLVAARKDEYRRKIRIAARSWHTHRYLRPRLRRMAALDRFKYVSRKVVRWFGGVFLLLGGASALILSWRVDPLLCAAILVGGAALLIAGLRAKQGLLASAGDILLAYFATLQGVFQAMRGRTFIVWNPPASR